MITFPFLNNLFFFLFLLFIVLHHIFKFSKLLAWLNPPPWLNPVLYLLPAGISPADCGWWKTHDQLHFKFIMDNLKGVLSAALPSWHIALVHLLSLSCTSGLQTVLAFQEGNLLLDPQHLSFLTDFCFSSRFTKERRTSHPTQVSEVVPMLFAS